MIWRIVLSIILSCSAYSEIFSYTDNTGKTYYVDDLNKVPSEYKTKVNSNLPKIGKVQSRTWDVQIPEKQLGKNETILLVTNSCPYCRLAEDHLTRKKVKFKKLDVENDPNGRKLYGELGGNGVPILKIKDEVVRGYSQGQYDRIIN